MSDPRDRRNHFTPAPRPALERARARTAASNTADEVRRRALLQKAGQRDTGQSMRDLESAVRGTHAAPPSADFMRAFSPAPVAANPSQAPQLQSRPTTGLGGGIVTRSQGVVNPPPVNNANGEGNGAASAATRTVEMKPVPKPLTGPMGDKASDRANLAQNVSMYQPGGMTKAPTAPAATAPSQWFDGPVDSSRIQALLDAGATSNTDGIARREAEAKRVATGVITSPEEAKGIAARFGDESGGSVVFRPPALNVPQKSVAGVSPAGAKNDINTGGDLPAAASGPRIARASDASGVPLSASGASPAATSPLSPAATTAPSIAATPAEAATSSAYAAGKATREAPGKLLDSIVGASDAATGKVADAASNTASKVSDYWSGLTGKQPVVAPMGPPAPPPPQATPQQSLRQAGIDSKPKSAQELLGIPKPVSLAGAKEFLDATTSAADASPRMTAAELFGQSGKELPPPMPLAQSVQSPAPLAEPARPTRHVGTLNPSSGYSNVSTAIPRGGIAEVNRIGAVNAFDSGDVDYDSASGSLARASAPFSYPNAEEEERKKRMAGAAAGSDWFNP